MKSTNSAYRQLAIAIRGLDVATLAAELQSKRLLEPDADLLLTLKETEVPLPARLAA